MADQTMFTPAERDRVREWLFATARSDDRITGGAVTGSRSVGREDRWSDVDTAFGVAPGIDAEAILRDWTQPFELEFDVVHRFDLRRDPTVYRVFLLGNELEVDVALTPATEFGPHGPTFELVFGQSTPQPSHASTVDELIGWAWIFVLYARAGIGRGRRWQAEYGITGVRENGLALACLRHELAVADARGIDDLPAQVVGPWREALARSVELDELRRALSAGRRALLTEVRHVDADLAARLGDVLPR